MQPSFGLSGPTIFDHFHEIAVVCPNPEPEPEAQPQTSHLSPSDWAEQVLRFKPSATQKTVLDSKDRFLILCCNRQWGKTTTIAVKALHRAIHNPEESIVIISRTKLQAAILIERACHFALRLGYPIRRALGQRESLKLPNGSAIFAVPHSQDTSLGNTATVLVVDEAALVKDAVYSSVTAFTSRTHGGIWLMSTPRRQAGFFFNIWHDKDDQWRRVFATIQDCPEIDRTFLAMQQRLDPTKFRQDFLCEFIQPNDRLIDRATVDAMVDTRIDQWCVPQWSGRTRDQDDHSRRPSWDEKDKGP